MRPEVEPPLLLGRLLLRPTRPLSLSEVTSSSGYSRKVDASESSTATACKEAPPPLPPLPLVCFLDAVLLPLRRRSSKSAASKSDAIAPPPPSSEDLLALKAKTMGSVPPLVSRDDSVNTPSAGAPACAAIMSPGEHAGASSVFSIHSSTVHRMNTTPQNCMKPDIVTKPASSGGSPSGARTYALQNVAESRAMSRPYASMMPNV